MKFPLLLTLAFALITLPACSSHKCCGTGTGSGKACCGTACSDHKVVKMPAKTN